MNRKTVPELWNLQELRRERATTRDLEPLPGLEPRPRRIDDEGPEMIGLANVRFVLTEG